MSACVGRLTLALALAGCAPTLGVELRAADPACVPESDRLRSPEGELTVARERGVFATAGSCDLSTFGVPVAGGVWAEGASPPSLDALEPGSYCLWGLELWRDEEGECGLLAVASETVTLPRERGEVALEPACVDASVEPAYDELVESLAGCRPACAPERCECSRACRDDATCPPVLDGRRFDISESHGCAAEDDDTLYCWSDEGKVRLELSAMEPWVMDGSPAIERVFVADDQEHSVCVTTVNRHVYCVRAGGESAGTGGAVVDGDADSLVGLDAVAMGDRHACGVSGGETVHCWSLAMAPTGMIEAGRIRLPGVQSLAAARNGEFCYVSSGTLSCFALDDASLDLVARPSPVSGTPGPWLLVEGGGDRMCALDLGGRVFCWRGMPVAGGSECLRGLEECEAARFTDIRVSSSGVCGRNYAGRVQCTSGDGVKPYDGYELLVPAAGFACGPRLVPAGSLGCRTYDRDGDPHDPAERAAMGLESTREGGDGVCAGSL